MDCEICGASDKPLSFEFEMSVCPECNEELHKNTKASPFGDTGGWAIQRSGVDKPKPQNDEASASPPSGTTGCSAAEAERPVTVSFTRLEAGSLINLLNTLAKSDKWSPGIAAHLARRVEQEARKGGW